MRWTEKEDAYVREHYNGHNAREIAETLGRTEKAVRTRSSLLGRGIAPEWKERGRRSGCRGCIFRQKYSGYPGCHYCLYTGRMRPCPPERCTVRDTDRARLEEYKRRLRFGGISEIVHTGED